MTGFRKGLIIFLGFYLNINPLMAKDLLVFEVSINDGRFSPTTIQVPANQRFKIIIVNIGAGPAEFESLPLRVEKVLAPNAKSFVVIHPLRPGSYQFIDEFHQESTGFNIMVKE